MKNLTVVFAVTILITACAFGGNKSVEWDPYTDAADGLNIYRTPSSEDGTVAHSWALVTPTPLPTTDTQFLDTAPPGFYCWQVKAVSGSFETPGSNLTCAEITLSEATGVR